MERLGAGRRSRRPAGAAGQPGRGRARTVSAPTMRASASVPPTSRRAKKATSSSAKTIPAGSYFVNAKTVVGAGKPRNGGVRWGRLRARRQPGNRGRRGTPASLGHQRVAAAALHLLRERNTRRRRTMAMQAQLTTTEADDARDGLRRRSRAAKKPRSMAIGVAAERAADDRQQVAATWRPRGSGGRADNRIA